MEEAHFYPRIMMTEKIAICILQERYSILVHNSEIL